MTVYKLFYVPILAIISAVFAPMAQASPIVENGYTYDVQSEKDERFYEIFLFIRPPSKQTDLKEVIFNRELSKEFKDKYREKFGQLDSESIIYQPTKFSVLDENRGAILSVEKSNNDRKVFGEYMLKRLSEWHIDNYFKTDPTMRPVYELKEKLSNLEVKVNKETKVNIRYSLSDNTADIIVDNPYVDAKLTLQMNPRQFGPGNIEEQKLVIEKQLEPKLRLNTWATYNDGIASAEIIRALKWNWSTSFRTTAAFKPGSPSPRESHYRVGIGHSF